MEIEYSLTMKDLSAFAGPLTEKKPKTDQTNRSCGLAIWTFILLLVVFWMLFLDTNRFSRFIDLAGGFLIGFLAGGAGIVIVLVISKKMLVLSNERYEADERNRWVFQEKKARIDPEGLRITSPTEQTKVAWRGICQIDATDHGAMFWTTTRSGYPIPRRAFRDQQHFEEFIAFARQYHQGLKSTGIITSLPPASTTIAMPDMP